MALLVFGSSAVTLNQRSGGKFISGITFVLYSYLTGASIASSLPVALVGWLIVAAAQNA